jgi:hypothetical protein
MTIAAAAHTASPMMSLPFSRASSSTTIRARLAGPLVVKNKLTNNRRRMFIRQRSIKNNNLNDRGLTLHVAAAAASPRSSAPVGLPHRL